MEEYKLNSEGGKRRGSQTIEGEEHWVEYNQCCVELCETVLICVHKEEKASAESTEGTRQLSILFVRLLLERHSTLGVNHSHLPVVWHAMTLVSI